MRANFPVVLDACVLANASLCDLFLRLAPLYLPRWSAKILAETQSTHLKLGWNQAASDKWLNAVQEAFPEAMVEDCDCHDQTAKNDPKDRHVVSAAIKSQSELIVTFNLRHFQKEHLDPLGIRSEHPSEYLITLYRIDSGLVVARIGAIASKKGKEPEEVLAHLRKSVPIFVDHISEALGLEIP
jgi:hypothetical protein